MKPIVFACLALLFYGIENVLLEQKLAKYNTFSLLIYFYLVMLPIAITCFAILKIRKQPIVVPTGTTIAIALVAGVLYFFADFFYVGAYTTGGSVLTVTTIVIMLPVVASVVKYFWVYKLPNIYQILGYILTALGVILVAKGRQ